VAYGKYWSVFKPASPQSMASAPNLKTFIEMKEVSSYRLPVASLHKRKFLCALLNDFGKDHFIVRGLIRKLATGNRRLKTIHRQTN